MLFSSTEQSNADKSRLYSSYYSLIFSCVACDSKKRWVLECCLSDFVASVGESGNREHCQVHVCRSSTCMYIIQVHVCRTSTCMYIIQVHVCRTSTCMYIIHAVLHSNSKVLGHILDQKLHVHIHVYTANTSPHTAAGMIGTHTHTTHKLHNTCNYMYCMYINER